MAQGVVKSYDPNTGNGIIILDTDKTEVYLTPGSLKGSIFRTLRQGMQYINTTRRGDLTPPNLICFSDIDIDLVENLEFCS